MYPNPPDEPWSPVPPSEDAAASSDDDDVVLVDDAAADSGEFEVDDDVSPALDTVLSIAKYAVLIAAALVLAVLRIQGYKSQTFQALSHLDVGLLIGGVCWSPKDRWFCVALVVPLIVVELVCFFAGRAAGCDCGMICPCLGGCSCG